MEMLSSIRGDKHEFCLVVIKFKHVAVAQALTLYCRTVSTWFLLQISHTECYVTNNNVYNVIINFLYFLF